MLKNNFLVHASAGICASIGFYIVYKISCLFFFPHQIITIPLYAKILWKSQEWFFRLLLVVNFIIKPVFIYYLAYVVFGELLFSRKK